MPSSREQRVRPEGGGDARAGAVAPAALPFTPDEIAPPEPSWRRQRVAWTGGLMVIAAALAGLLGHGPVSNRRVMSADDSLTVEYSRIVQAHAPVDLVVAATPAAGADLLVLSLTGMDLEMTTPDRVIPEPESVLAGPEGLSLALLASAHGAPVRVRIVLRHERAGRVRIVLGREFGGDAGATVEIRQLVLP